MHKNTGFGLIFAFTCAMIFLISGCVNVTETSTKSSYGVLTGRETVTQVSTIDALLAGVYDSVIDCGRLKQYGDLGVGTFEALDGEMVVLDGTVYQVKSDGTVAPVEDTLGVPFAAVTYFEPDIQAQISGGFTLEALEAGLDEMISSENIFCAVKIDGTFSYIKTRSVPAQEKPYPPLAEVTANQSVFEFENITGTIVGFKCPEYVSGVNVAGYHLHFISEDRQSGGHLLALNGDNLAAALDETAGFYMMLPGEESEFYSLDLTEDQSATLEKVEK